ncbi:Rieske (2Fe-2S) protein [Paenibacillus sp.]|uniref:Rieske (2Fe-2S) protein n=1 Tax=Paenibacillus sp. TaxID=58172 RepID=UPI0028115ED4|nr:Rieske (2Fe-2S) protein [Paenibacillus sp.]
MIPAINPTTVGGWSIPFRDFLDAAARTGFPAIDYSVEPFAEVARTQPLRFAAAADDLAEGTSILVDVGGRTIGVFRVGGRYYAFHNYCPHAGAPLCLGQVVGTTLPSAVYEYAFGRQGEIIRCPWHGWEFDMTTGRSLANPKVRAKSYEVRVEDGGSASSIERKASSQRSYEKKLPISQYSE